MIQETWLYGALLSALLVHLAVLFYARTRGDHPTARARWSEEYVSGDGVECPRCGASNARGYRFCRSCVSELPGAVDIGRPTTVPFGRKIG